MISEKELKEFNDAKTHAQNLYKSYRRNEKDAMEYVNKINKPVVEAVKEVGNIIKHENKEIVPYSFKPDANSTVYLDANDESKIYEIEQNSPQDIVEGSNLIHQYLNYRNTETIKKLKDETFGIRSSNHTIGNRNIKISWDNEDIIIHKHLSNTLEEKRYKLTKGLAQLLTLEEPKTFTQDDYEKYSDILIYSDAITETVRKAYPRSSAGYKWVNVVRPIWLKWKNSQKGSTPKKQPEIHKYNVNRHIEGSGLKEYNNKEKEFVYWNDIDELEKRLNFLQAEKQAGNDNVHNEIMNIEEELKEESLKYTYINGARQVW